MYLVTQTFERVVFQWGSEDHATQHTTAHIWMTLDEAMQYFENGKERHNVKEFFSDQYMDDDTTRGQKRKRGSR